MENVPSTSPAIAASVGKDEALDFTIIEEKIGARPSAAESGDTQGDAKIEGKVREELFGTMPEPQAPQAQPTPQAALAPAATDDQMRLIVKDFMYGLVFGLVIGIILGRIISF